MIIGNITGILAGNRETSWSRYWATRYPSTPSLVIDSNTQATFTWANNGTQDYDSVSIERKTSTTSFAVIGTGDPGDTEYVDTTVLDGIQYYYRARYKRGSNYSPYTDEVHDDTPIWCNYLTTPNATANQITGDITVWIDLEILSMADGQKIRFGKWEDNHEDYNNDAWKLEIERSGSTYYFTCSFTTDGVPAAGNGWGNFYSRNISSGGVFTIKLRRIAATGVITYTVNGGTPTDATKASGNLYNSSRPVMIGDYENTSKVKINEVKVYAGDMDDGGTLKMHLTPQDFDPAVSTTVITASDTGEVWTMTRAESGFGDDSISMEKLFFLNEIIMPDIYLNNGEESIVRFYQLMNTDAAKVLDYDLVGTMEGGFTLAASGLTLSPETADIGDIPCTCALKDLSDNVLQLRVVDLKVADSSLVPAKKVLCIGDSFTDMGKYQHYLLDDLAGTIFTGIRKTSGYDIMGLGFGGWNLNWFSTLLHPGIDKMHSPLVQPKSPYHYYGETGFWKNTWDDPTSYNVYGFETFRDAKGFIEATGYLSNPNTNDVVYDTDLAVYKVWSGSSWDTITEETLDFDIRFSTYLEAWGDLQPDFVTIMFATNDCNYTSDRDNEYAYVTFESQLRKLVNSIKETGAKVLYLIPSLVAAGDATRDIRALSEIFFMRNLIRYMSDVVDLYFIDTGTALIQNDDYTDTVHPSNVGMQKIAKKFVAALRIHDN